MNYFYKVNVVTSIEDAYFFLTCKPFDKSQSSKEWIQCVVHKKNNKRCAKGNVLSYICLSFESDHSDILLKNKIIILFTMFFFFR